MPGPGWYFCDVMSAGPSDDGNINIALRQVNGEFELWFHALQATKQPMLATALMAMSTGRRVNVQLSDTKQFSQIYRLYVDKDR